MDGTDFCPAGDPAVLERGAAAWADLATAMADVKADLDAAVRAALPEWTGAAADAFERWWAEQSTILLNLADNGEEMAATLQEGADGVDTANRLYQSQVVMMWVEVNAAVAPLLSNPFTMLIAPAVLAAVNGAMVALVQEADASFVTGAGTAVHVVASTTVAVAVGVVFAPAGAAVEAAATTMVGIVQSVFQAITISIQMAVQIIQVAVQALISAMTTLVMGLAESAFTHSFTDGSPFAGWTGHEVGGIALDTGLAALPLGALLPGSVGVQLAADVVQGAGEAIVTNAYDGGDIEDAITLETVLMTGLSMATSHAVAGAFDAGGSRTDLSKNPIFDPKAPGTGRKPIDQRLQTSGRSDSSKKPGNTRSIDDVIESKTVHRDERGTNSKKPLPQTLAPQGDSSRKNRRPRADANASTTPVSDATRMDVQAKRQRRPRADAVAADHPLAPVRRPRADADAGRLLPPVELGKPRRASASELLEAAERRMTPGQLRELKEAFSSIGWSYGTTGEASPSAIKDAVEGFLVTKERKGVHRLRQNAENKKAAREGRAPRKLGDTPPSLYWPGARAVEVVRNGRQMMDNYYGQGGTTMHEARNPVVGAWLHEMMGFRGEYDHSKSGRDTYLENYGGKDKVEGWADPPKGAELFLDEHGNTLTGTKEMSRLIREGVQRYGGLLVIDGKNVVNDTILKQREDGGDADWANLAGLRDTNVEMRALLPVFAENPGQSRVKFGEGELVFQWGGQELVPTQERLLSSWSWSAPKRGGKYGSLTMDQAKKVIPADSPFWKLPVDDADVAARAAGQP